VVEAAPEAIVILTDEKISFINQTGLELLKAKNKNQFTIVLPELSKLEDVFDSW
jgi:hypothetical protein